MNLRLYNARILTMEPGRDIFQGEIWVKNEKIVYVADQEDFLRQNPDGGGGDDWHLPGPGVPTGEKRLKDHACLPVGVNTPGGFCIFLWRL